MGWASVAVRTAASLATVFALLALPIALVSSLSRGDLIGLAGGILVFVCSILVLVVLVGLIWTVRR
jgi:hypothetical protein